MADLRITDRMEAGALVVMAVFLLPFAILAVPFYILGWLALSIRERLERP